jgi:hypothetical protein
MEKQIFKTRFYQEPTSLNWKLWTFWCKCYYITYSKGRRGREAFSIHPSRHPSMDGITWPVHPSISLSIHGWHHTGKKTLAEINNPPSAHVLLSRKGMPGPGLRSFTMVSCMLLSHRSQAVQTSRFSAVRVPMDTCGMWYIERFWKCSL